MRIFLTGYMGAGKSTTAARLSRKLGISYLDLDEYIEARDGVSIPVMIRGAGERLFRQKEHLALREVINERDGLVIATGGGTPCFHDNMAIMKRSGITVYLRLQPGSLFRRLAEAKRSRPLLEDLNKEELLEHIRKQVEERERYYLQADIVIRGEDLDLPALIQKITDLTGKKTSS